MMSEEDEDLFGSSGDEDKAIDSNVIQPSELIESDDEVEDATALRPVPETLSLPECLPHLQDKVVRLCRMPNFAHLEPCVYDPNLYEERMEGARLKNIGKDFVGDNIIRWRFKLDEEGKRIYKDDVPLLESNSRFVEWEDGTLQLLVGDVAFDIETREPHNQFVYAVGEPNERIMQAVSVISETMKLKPTGIASAAHKTLELKMKSRNLKPVRVQTINVDVDPEKEQDQRVKEADDRIRSGNRQKAKSGSRPGFNEDYFNRRDGKASTLSMRKKTFEADSDGNSSDISDDAPKPKKRSIEETPKPNKPQKTVLFAKRDEAEEEDDISVSAMPTSKKSRVVLDSDSD